jgi:hypothetical protein
VGGAARPYPGEKGRGGVVRQSVRSSERGEGVPAADNAWRRRGRARRGATLGAVRYGGAWAMPGEPGLVREEGEWAGPRETVSGGGGKLIRI